MRHKIAIKISVLFILICGISVNSFAQLKKGNNHFSLGEYSNAISYYQKALKKDTANQEATENIAYSYRKIKDYTNAETFYAKAITISPDKAENYLYYGQALKNNDKTKQAKQQFEKYVTKNPKSLIGKLLVKSCDDITDWEIEKKAFEVSLVENINTKNADFSPIEYKGGIVFVSERGVDLVNGTQSGMANQPYQSIYYAKEEKQYKKAKRFSAQLTSPYHDGPSTISKSGETIYFNKVNKKEHGKTFLNRLQIFSAELVGKKWKNITPFEYNSDNYSVAHPWISDDGEQLFFASDMAQGYGGMDIYVCKKEDEKWGQPINLGSGVNTPQNEVFPYFRSKVLYFSSDGHSGYGGLDIYSVMEDDGWSPIENLKSPLNSSKDDFGIFYKDDENGYFSSNRDGGVGSDDIYRFSWHQVDFQTEISGVLELEKLGVARTTINLLDDNDNIVETTITDEYGKFKFSKLKMDENYMLEIVSEDDSFLEKSKLYVTNSEGEKVLMANRIDKRKFQFKALPHEYYDELDVMSEDDGTLLTADVFGQIFKKLPGDYKAGMEVWVVDDEGNIIGRSVTDKDGKFVFKKLSVEEQYMFMLAEDDPDVNIVIVNKKGEVLDAVKRLIDGKYRYVKLESDDNVLTMMQEVDEPSIFNRFVYGQIYKKLPGDYSGGMEVYMIDDDGNVLKTTKANKNGIFSFAKLPTEEDYLFMLAENDGSLKVNILDEDGKLLAKAKYLGDKKFEYLKLDNNENSLTNIDEQDASLVDKTIKGQLFKKLPGDYSGGMEVWMVDDEGNIIGRAITNEDGTFTFTKLPADDNYLFMLAENDESIKINFIDANGNVLANAVRQGNGKYKYTKLSTDESNVQLLSEVDESKIIVNERDVFVSSEISYEYNSFQLVKDAKKELDKVVVILTKNKTVGVELGAHTDSKGSAEYNMELSQKRVKGVLNYIVSKGVKKERIVAKSYGETKPIAPNKFPNGNDNPAGRAKNRRTEFKIIKLK